MASTATITPIIPARKSTRTRTTSRPRAASPAATAGVMAQIAAAARSPGALLVGAIFGAFVPIATFTVAHYELDAGRPLYAQAPALLVLGGLVFSALTVFAWGRLAFRSGLKALGFVTLIEGTMVLSTTSWLGIVALALLVAVNATATGATLANDRGK
jgi:hypothetical protein